MSLKSRIETMLEFEDVVVAENQSETPTGKTMNNYVVNKRGVVLQFAIPADVDDEGVIEDFLEYIEATVNQLD